MKGRSLFALAGACLILLLTRVTLSGQVPSVSDNLNALRSSSEPVRSNLFTTAPQPPSRNDEYNYLREYDRLELSEAERANLLESKPDYLEIPVPGEHDLVLELYQVDLFAPTYKLRSSRNEVFPFQNMLFYHGKVVGADKSLATVSVYEDEIRVMYAGKTGTYRIHRAEGEYIRYKDADLIDDREYECFTSDNTFPRNSTRTRLEPNRSTGSCVEIYFECDYESYLDNGSSVSETEQWVADLFNEVSIFYEDNNVPVSVSEIKVWTSADPYIDFTSTGAMLGEFVDQCATNGYNGRLAHLLSTRGVGGGIAYVDVICSTTVPCAVSGSLNTNITPVPNYSWNVNVVTHELGHNFGSSHTHSCVWNGNNTQIDDCGNEWSSNPNAPCYDSNNPILPESGTIMSYCHLISGIGIDFNNGFGEQPANLIYNNFITASCNTGECFAPVCTEITDPAPNSTDIETSSLIKWALVPGADGYLVSLGTSPGATDIADHVNVVNETEYDPQGLPFNEDVYVNIIPYNQLGDATDCSDQSFTTEPSGNPECTQLDFPADGEIDVSFEADLAWTHSVGAQLGYKIDMGFTAGGTELFNGFDVGNVTTFDPGTLPPDTTLYVKIIPYGSGGFELESCTITSFTTKGYGNDFCSGALPIECGTTVSGSTEEATTDDLSTCGTSITAPGVWYTFTGDGSNVVLSMCGAADYDTKMNVFRGTCADLICVTGNDDEPGCNYASQVEITTIANAQYYVFVQGWNNNVGNFNLTMACADPPVCPSQAILADDEWISGVSIGDFSNPSGAAVYSDFTDMLIDVTAGSSYAITITPDFVQGSFEEYFGIWVDFNGNGSFDDADETLFQTGPSTSEVTGEITIPGGIADGEYLLRVVMKFDGAPVPCEVFTYGEVEEYTLRIGFAGPQGGCEPITTNTNDSGDGSLRQIIDCASSGDTITFGPGMQNKTIILNSGPLIIDKDLTIMGPSQNITVSAASSTRVFQVADGVDFEIYGIDLKGGTAADGSGIRNFGNLTLRDIVIEQHDGQTGNVLLENLGQLLLLGDCVILDP